MSVCVCEREGEITERAFCSPVRVSVSGAYGGLCLVPGAFTLTCVEAVLVSGAVAVKGEGGASEGAGCC